MAGVMVRSTCIPESIEVESQAEYIALCYVYDFVLAMSGFFADWPTITDITPETKEFVDKVERAFSKLSVYVYQLLARASQYEKGEVPECQKWPEIDIDGGSKGGDCLWEQELRPLPCWLKKGR